MSSNKTTPTRLYQPPHMRFRHNNNSDFSKNENLMKIENKSALVKSTSLSNFFNEKPNKIYIPPALRSIQEADQNKINNNFDVNDTYSDYKDRMFKGSNLEYRKKLETSKTIYVGKLNLCSTESDIYDLFSKAGQIKRIIMGIDKETKGSGGFCFIEYETRLGAETCMTTMHNAVLDGKSVNVDWDAGFVEGRQYCRVKQNKKYLFSNFSSKFVQPKW
ncbi:nuclear cap-binding protein subunit 2-like [Daktulosphaira vitifoliae]|uniref:nuclear cap-binding protein subunit 2-like n=1 Tax=Daktulosphaira vitifoliae TaxID=58002 RepID=UPI0021AA86B5|nr:nuclear cap-binding protein subunit 2-like [Daktulosphaira vitifoliae]